MGEEEQAAPRRGYHTEYVDGCYGVPPAVAEEIRKEKEDG